MLDKEKLLTFPCEFPIKAFGYSSGSFEKNILSLVKNHVEDSFILETRTNAGKSNKYLAITITINAQSQEQIDNVYRDLSSSDFVVMAL